MLIDNHNAEGKQLLSYVVASGDMRNIPINDREVYLRIDPELGLILQGEVPECGFECHANLSQILLEYTMSCEDCHNRGSTAKNADQFGERLGNQLVTKIYGDNAVTSEIAQVSELMEIILNSMDIAFQTDHKVDQLQFDLAQCPIHRSAGSLGLNLWVASAHRAFVALCSYIISTLASDWVLLNPSKPETDVPLDTILITRK